MDDFKHTPQAERRLRRMLCIAVAKGSPYMDDGEAQCNAGDPTIDFMRDSLDTIQAKLQERGIKSVSTLGRKPVGVLFMGPIPRAVTFDDGSICVSQDGCTWTPSGITEASKEAIEKLEAEGFWKPT